MSRYDLTDFELRLSEPLSPNKPWGVQRVDYRRVLNGIYGCCARLPRGATCPTATARAPNPTTASCASDGRMCGIG